MLLTPLDVAIRGLSGPVRLAPTPLEVALRGLVAPVRFAEEVAGPQSLLNVEKLSLDPATPVGTQVSVSDGFVVSGSGDVDADGFYPIHVPTETEQLAVYYNGNDPARSVVRWEANSIPVGESYVSGWTLRLPNSTLLDYSVDNVPNPWDANWSIVTLTHPAIQSLAAASTAQGGVFVAGGTQDGVYSYREGYGPGLVVLLGIGSDNFPAIDKAAATWRIKDIDATIVYYDESNAADPSLASSWKNWSDDSPASITVTSVTAGQLAAGLRIGDVTRAVNGSLNGRGKYSDVLGVAPDVTWDGTKWTDGTTDGTGNTAFPWMAGLGEQDNVASESNWTAA